MDHLYIYLISRIIPCLPIIHCVTEARDLNLREHIFPFYLGLFIPWQSIWFVWFVWNGVVITFLARVKVHCFLE